MQGLIARCAKLIVTALVKPNDAFEQVGHGAIDRVVGWFALAERSRYDRLVGEVEERLRTLPAHEFGGVERIEQVLSTAQAYFQEGGLTVGDLVRRGLDRDAAVAAQQERFDRWLPGQDATVGPICREHVIPAVLDGLFADENALAEIDLAFKQAVLAKLDQIEREPGIAATLKAMAAEAVLTRQRVMPWIAGRHPPSALLVRSAGS